MSILVHLAQTTFDTVNSTDSSSFNSSGLYNPLNIFVIIGMWKTFSKAGQPGWASLIPFYNVYVQFKMAKTPGKWAWWLLLPIIGWIVFGVKIALDSGRQFGKSGVWSFFLLGIFGFVGWMMLGFGKDTYLNLPADGSAPMPSQPAAPTAPQPPTV
jgi:Family of unknown function (DUF5684)